MESNYESRIRFSDCSKLAVNRKKDNDFTIYWQDLIAKIFWCFFVPPVRVSYWLKFHVSISTGSGVMTIFLYKGLIRNQEIGNILTWVSPNIWSLGRVRDATFGKNISHEILMNAAKCQGYSLYRFWVIKGKGDANNLIAKKDVHIGFGSKIQ